MTALDRILAKKVILLDGGLGSELEKRNIKINNELWSASALLQSPDTIKSIHRDYFNAGSQIAITDTYQVHIPSAADTSTGYKLIDLAVDLARQALNESLETEGIIAGSIGPYGAYLANGAEYTGDYQLTQREYQLFHHERITRLVQDQVDVLLLETMPNFEEVKAIVDLITTEFPETSIFLSFSTEGGVHLWDGTSLSYAVKSLEHVKQIRAIGVNCTEPENILKAIQNIRPYTTKKIIVYPNAGDTYDPTSKRWINDHGPIDWTTLVPQWVRAGAEIIGGCCRTSPEDIFEIKKILNKNYKAL